MTLADVPTMSRRRRIAFAAERYGRTDPSPDDVLSARWPMYEQGDAIHVAGYHEDFSAVLRLVLKGTPATVCRTCGTEMWPKQGKGQSNRRFCSTACVSAAQSKREKVGAHNRLSLAERERCAELYVRGLSIKDVAKEIERSATAVREALLAEGVTLRPARGQRPVNGLRAHNSAFYRRAMADKEAA